MSINSRHHIAALWREGMKPKGRVWAARGARGRCPSSGHFEGLALSVSRHLRKGGAFL